MCFTQNKGRRLNPPNLLSNVKRKKKIKLQKKTQFILRVHKDIICKNKQTKVKKDYNIL